MANQHMLAACGPLTEALAGVESASNGELSELTGLDKLQVRNALLAMEQLGLVYRTGRARSTRWWLG
jgi:DNA-binding IclR family transcriptional regulator